MSLQTIDFDKNTVRKLKKMNAISLMLTHAQPKYPENPVHSSK